MRARLVIGVASLLLAAAVAEAVLWEGGFAPAARIVFGVLALAALLASAIADRAATARVAASPVALTLWALAALGAASAAWTIASPGDAVRWGLVTAGYGAIVVAAAVAARRRRGAEAIAGGICALAAISGIVGLVAATITGEPFADLIRGTWHPGGTLEYSSALALLEISALPALLTAMCSRRRTLGAAGVAGATIAGAVLALADSRLELALAASIACAAIALPARTVRAGRARALAAVLAVATAGLAAHLIAGGHFPAGSSPGAWRLVGVAAACALVCAAWLAPRPRPNRRTRVAIASAATLAAVAALGVAAAAGAGPASRDDSSRHPVASGGGFLHGRAQLWDAGLDAFAVRPIAGSGADSFLLASARYQRGGPIRFAHDLPLELAVELGVLGLIAALALYVTTARAVWRARARRAAWLLGPGALAFLAASLVDWPWHLAGSGAVWAACTGALLSSSVYTRPERVSR